MKEDVRHHLMSLQEAMETLHVSRATIDRWRKYKHLPYIKIGKEVWVDRRELEAWIGSHASDTMSVRKEAVWHTREEEQAVIKIGYQSGAALLWSPLIIKAKGWLEEELEQLYPQRTPRIEWINAPNGMELVEKLVTGEVHIASVGDYPMMASRTLGAILPRFRPQVLAFDGKTKGGVGISLVVSANQPSSGMAQLAASAISIVGHSSSSHRYQEWTESVGFEGPPVYYRSMSECLSGMIEGRAGGGILWEPYISWMIAAGKGQTLSMHAAGSDYLTGLLTDGNWAQQHEAAVIAYLKAHLRAHRLIREDRNAAVACIRTASGFSAELIASVLQRIRWDAPLYSRDLLTLSDNWLGASRWTRSGQPAHSGLEFRTDYLQQAVRALDLPLLPDIPLSGEWCKESEAIY